MKTATGMEMQTKIVLALWKLEIDISRQMDCYLCSKNKDVDQLNMLYKILDSCDLMRISIPGWEPKNQIFLQHSKHLIDILAFT